MSPIRYRDDEPSLGTTITHVALGALLGFVAGVVIAERSGGLSSLTSRLRSRFQRDELDAGEDDEGMADEDDGEEHVLDAHAYDDESDDSMDEYSEDDIVADEANAELEERVLEAFRNDPTLSERGVDIGAIDEGIIELSGWVDTEMERERASTIAGGVPGVSSVVNRISVGQEEAAFDDAARRFDEGDPALTEARWEGQRVGTGRRRQGTSDEPDRHASPKPELEDRWMKEEKALANAAEDVPEGSGERTAGKRKGARGGRTDGSPVAPTGVPKADHVADPLNAPKAD